MGPVAWAVVVALVGATLLLTSTASLARTRGIRGVGTEWQPSSRRITAGDRIVWKAVQNPHTVTAYRKKSGKRGRRWRKDVTLSVGESTRKRFNRPGLYRFKCEIHSGMNGRVRVART